MCVILCVKRHLTDKKINITKALESHFCPFSKNAILKMWMDLSVKAFRIFFLHCRMEMFVYSLE